MTDIHIYLHRKGKTLDAKLETEAEVLRGARVARRIGWSERGLIEYLPKVGVPTGSDWFELAMKEFRKKPGQDADVELLKLEREKLENLQKAYTEATRQGNGVVARDFLQQIERCKKNIERYKKATP